MPHSSSHQPSAVSPQPQVDMPFTKADAYAAGSEWGFNCGPGALCAVTGLKPAEIRSAMGDFESKGYTNPRLMREILARLKIKWYAICLDALRPQFPVDRCFPVFGLVRVQWGGPWMRPGVPVRARYRHTHWIASRQRGRSIEVFDVNAVCGDLGWTSFDWWNSVLVPWLVDECEPESDGSWTPTHCWEVAR